MHRVAIVTPVYKTHLSPDEEKSITLRDRYLSRYDHIAIAPTSLRTIPFRAQRVSFDDSCFENIASYSKLLLTREFYQKFSSYDYILIYQLDALVLQDKLEYWCDSGYSYIGAPWYQSVIGFLTAPGGKLVGGNGGFSLRNIDHSLAVFDAIDKITPTIRIPHRGRWLTQAEDYPFNEDGFWSFEAQKYLPTFRPAPFKESLGFAFELDPKECFTRNGNTQPFGVHAWRKYDPSFWEKTLASQI